LASTTKVVILRRGHHYASVPGRARRAATDARRASGSQREDADRGHVQPCPAPRRRASECRGGVHAVCTRPPHTRRERLVQAT